MSHEFNFMSTQVTLTLFMFHLLNKVVKFSESLGFMKQRRLNHDAAVPAQRYSAVLESEPRDGAGHVR